MLSSLFNFSFPSNSFISNAFLKFFSTTTRTAEHGVEYQKMMHEELYNANDPELFNLRVRSKQLCYQMNQTPAGDQPAIRKIFSQLINIPGNPETITIETPFHCDYGCNITIGDGTYINYNCTILDVGPINIGKSVLIAPDVGIYSATHPISPADRLSGKELQHPITIKDNVWIGGGVRICPGVTIGENSVIGTGSVVVKDIPPNSVAVGNPAKVIKKLTPP